MFQDESCMFLFLGAVGKLFLALCLTGGVSDLRDGF